MYLALYVSFTDPRPLSVPGGCLLSWGWNEHGMCGNGLQTNVPHPGLISNLQPILIGCGAGHSMAVCTRTIGSTGAGMQCGMKL